MKSTLLTATVLLTAISFVAPARAENLDHTNQLLDTKQCVDCDLSNAGLAYMNLSGAKLSGANLTRANLSRADLTGADLSGANLSGASLHGAILAGANLSGANLFSTDLRDAYLAGAYLCGTNIASAYTLGAIGVSACAGTPDQFNAWGVLEANQGHFTAAIENYNKALSLDPEFAPAYLNRGLVLYKLGNEAAAIQNATIASQLFEQQGNEIGQQRSDNFLEGIELAREVSDKRNSGPSGIERVLGGVGSLLFQLFF